MYFKLDEEDFIFDQNHERLYRLVATEKFFTISPDTDDLIRNTLTIQEGTKGGYVGSEFCLEEKLHYKLKPWVFYGSQLSAGCILSGCSILTGRSVVLDESVIEGAHVIKDSTIINSTISMDDYKIKGNRVLLSTYTYRNSKIEDTVIKNNNIVIRNSSLKTCDINEGYGNVRLKNAIMENIAISHNVAIYDCDVKCDGDMGILKPNMTYDGGDAIEGIPANISVKIKGRPQTHESIFNEWEGSKITSSGQGIYKNVDYNPTQFN